MFFFEVPLKGAFVVEMDRKEDPRGYFARTFCRREFEAHGLNPEVVQSSVAFNAKLGTIRGMHFQLPPAAETKLVRCTRGALLDIIVDLRPESPTYLRHFAIELSEENGKALYIPERFAHGYQTLRDEAEASYQMGEFYAPELAGGLPYDDPRLGLAWPLSVTAISDKDRSWEPLRTQEEELKRRMSQCSTRSLGFGDD